MSLLSFFFNILCSPKNNNRPLLYFVLSVLLTFVIFPLPTVYAQVGEDNTNERVDIYNMSLEEILNINVVTASKNSENQTVAPAVMTIITDKDIAVYGDMSVSEILDRVVNFYVSGTYLIPKNNVNIRGEHTGLYDTHVLWLLNGRPMRESVHAGVNAAILNMFPVESIQRIEVIRGPGSVLYGTSAFQGVINIITKEAVRDVEVYAASKTGSFHTKQSELSVRTNISDNLSINIGFNQYSNDGWNASTTFENDQHINTDLFQHGYGGVLNMSYKNLRVDAYYGYDKQRQWGKVYVIMERKFSL